MEKDLLIKQLVDVHDDDLSIVKMRPHFVRNKKYVKSIGYGLYIFFTVILVAHANDGQLTVKNIIAAHKKALKIYKTEHDTFDAMRALRDGGVDRIIEKKPDGMNDSEYVSVLNDYGFFLIDRIDESDYDLSIKILKRVITISPDRTPAYLNLGDALYKKLRYLFTYPEKIKMAKEIESHYLTYKNRSKIRIERVERYLKYNISKDTSKNICEYIVTGANNGCLNEMLSLPANAVEMTNSINEHRDQKITSTDDIPHLCDIDNDGKKEKVFRFGTIQGSKPHWITAIQMQRQGSKEWVDIEFTQLEAYDAFEMLVDNFSGIAIVPYRDGVYYARCNMDPMNVISFRYIGAVNKLTRNSDKRICSFDVVTKVKPDKCKDAQLCEFVLSQKKLDYLPPNKKTRVIDKFKFGNGYPIDVEYKPFFYNNRYLFDVKSKTNSCPFREIWEIKNGIKDVVLSFQFDEKHQVSTSDL